MITNEILSLLLFSAFLIIVCFSYSYLQTLQYTLNLTLDFLRHLYADRIEPIRSNEYDTHLELGTFNTTKRNYDRVTIIKRRDSFWNHYSSYT